MSEYPNSLLRYVCVIAKNLLLSVVTIFLLYVVIEIFGLDILMRYLLFIAYPLVGETSLVLQRTKDGVEPKDYVAIVGDSYAVGLGDESYLSYLSTHEHGSAPHLYKALHKDVMSFGKSGAGSVDGMVVYPLLYSKYFNNGWRVSIDHPEVLLVYFYEGNDFSDNIENLEYLQRKFKEISPSRIMDSGYFEHIIQNFSIDQSGLNKSIESRRWFDELYMGRFLIKSFPYFFENLHVLTNFLSPDYSVSPLIMPGRFGWKDPGVVNQILMQSKRMKIPDQLQGPSSLGLTEYEKNLSLFVFRESLKFLVKSIPDARVYVVYIPSVLSSYEISSSDVSVQYFRSESAVVFSTADAVNESNWGASSIRQIAELEGVGFIDTRPVVRGVGRSEKLHGPYDWNHFNAVGYRALSQGIIPVLQKDLVLGDSGQ